MRAALGLACGAVVVLVPFYLLVRANAAWTPHPRFFPDDAVYARMCFPEGFAVYWNDFGLYRLLAVPAYALSNRAVMRASLSPVPFTLIALAFASVVFTGACVSAGLSRRRAVLLAGVLLSSPLLLETLNFWSGTFNYALVLLLVSAQLRASAWARRRFANEPSKGLVVTACGALLALLTYEIALPFILATSAFHVRGWWRRAATVGVACVAIVALVAVLAATGLYWPHRFKLAAERFTSALPGAGATTGGTNNSTDTNNPANTNAKANANHSVNANDSANANDSVNTTANGGTSETVVTEADGETLPAFAPPASAPERARMYVSLLFSFIRTGLSSPWWWGVVLALVGAAFLSRRAAGEPASEVAGKAAVEAAGEAAREGRLPGSVTAWAFAFALVACVGYLALTKSMNARYVAFLLIYGAATLAWMKGRVACCALASLLLVQAAVAAGLPVHMRDVELAATGATTVSHASLPGDLVSVNGRLARSSWGKRFHAPAPDNLLTRPFGCRYAVPCEECK